MANSTNLGNGKKYCILIGNSAVQCPLTLPPLMSIPFKENTVPGCHSFHPSLPFYKLVACWASNRLLYRSNRNWWSPGTCPSQMAGWLDGETTKWLVAGRVCCLWVAWGLAALKLSPLSLNRPRSRLSLVVVMSVCFPLACNLFWGLFSAAKWVCFIRPWSDMLLNWSIF